MSVAAADEENTGQETIINIMEVNVNREPDIPELSVPAADIIEEEIMDKETKPLSVEGDDGNDRCTNLSCLLNVALDSIQEIVSK